MYTLLDGKAVSAKLRGKIKENVEKYKNNKKNNPRNVCPNN